MSAGYTDAFAKLGSRVRVAAAVDVDMAKAKASAEKLDGAQAATDYRLVLDKVDAVMLILPHHLHHQIGMDCLAAGKHVLIEKPLANSERECIDLIDAAEKASRVLMVAYCMRYHPLVARLKELVDEKVYGELFQLSIWTEQHTQYPLDHWASKAATLGGGQLFSHGCHYIDLLLWFLGRPVEGTHLGTNYCTPWMEKEGTSNVSLKFENGSLGYHFGTWGARGTRLGYSLHAHCADGLIEAHITDGKIYSHVGDKVETLMECEPGKHVRNEIKHFVECIETGATPLTDAPSSLQGLRVIWRLYEAEQRGAVADLRGLGLDEV